MRFPQTNKPPLGSMINWAHPLAKGLVGCWLMNEGSGLYVSDLSGNGNRGTLTNGPLWTPGRSGQALSFDATDDYVTLSAAALSNNTPFTITWWERMTTNSAVYPSRFILQMTGTSNYFLVIRTRDVALYGPLVFGVSPNTSLSIRAALQPTNEAGVGIWRHYAITGSNPNSTTPSNYAFYVNGISYTLDSGGTFSSVLNNRIGHDGTDSPADASFDYVLIYNRALSANEIQWLYQFPYAMFERRPVWMDYVAVAAGLSIPVAMYQYRRMRDN